MKNKMRKPKGLPRTGEVSLPETITILKQPNTVTLMSYDYTQYQLKALITVIEHLQDPISACISNPNIAPEQLSLFDPKKDSISLVIPINRFGIQAKYYDKLKEMIVQLATIPVTLDAKDPITGAESWVVKGLLRAYIPKEKYSRTITIEIDKDVALLLVGVNSGFTRFVKEIAMNASSKYTTRIYMLISSWRDKGGFSIKLSEFRKWLDITPSKYANYKDLYRWVLRPVYEELFEKADCWFEVDASYKDGVKEPYKLTFNIITSNMYEEEKKRLIQYKEAIRKYWKDFKFNDNVVEALQNRITNENVNPILTKTIELHEYVGKVDIKNITKYAFASLDNELKLYEKGN